MNKEIGGRLAQPYSQQLWPSLRSDSAFYTRRLALSTEDTAIRQNRAYVQVDIEKIFIGVGATIEIVLKVSNVGKTPAYDVVGYSWVDLRPFPHPPNGNFVGPTNPGPESKMIINGGQGHRIKTGSANPITQSQAAAIALGATSRLYVFGNCTLQRCL